MNSTILYIIFLTTGIVTGKVTFGTNDKFNPQQEINMKDLMGLTVRNNDHDTIKGKVFTQFPLDKEYYAEDIQPVIAEILAKHGAEEFRNGILTSELHGHLGIYAIIGVKMGMRAKEYFGNTADEIKVITWTGNQPPLSCLNDGIQVSTGATVGHGLIAIMDDSDFLPKAKFMHNGHQLTIELKKTYRDVIKSDITEALERYGGLTPGYWNFIRELTINCWVGWDRNEIFTIY